MRVIVVEDNVLFCNYICNFLQKADLDTVRTYRLAQAKKIIGTSIREDDIVLADLRLPDGESTTLLQWMRENLSLIHINTALYGTGERFFAFYVERWRQCCIASESTG